MARHRDIPVDAPPTQRVLGLPWLGLLLAGLVAVALVLLMAPPRYVATATLGADSPRESARAAVELGRADLRSRSFEAMELGSGWSGRIRLEVEHDAAGAQVHVTAHATDPRLAALTADTAAALVVAERDGRLWLQEAAQVPVRPEGGVPGWAWGATGLALLGATLLEFRQRRRMLRSGAGLILRRAAA